ncbi:cell division protein FtsZ [Hasllibacter halocynthiae]|uniref:Cell division protein FtsZ n=1 Tax=Hasllibacter halocynthiae TaxID=595589 RepID=A0A2T0X9E5_9RHOB|nr:cell division protein FtsZ [Hasllibacter halocynthiae]PRY95570.1 cell division protein FtsZ [Hasllibacter halocynthiae]
MALTLTMSSPDGEELKPRITVFGVGGAGGNAVDNMIAKNLDGVEFVVGNTDAQALSQSDAQHRVQLGVKATEGLGAGARPQVGQQAAEETLEQIIDHLAGAHMCFITAGMGGGTGTGAAPVIAQAARELGVLTVGVVTKPFQFEGSRRMKQAEEGIEALQKHVDTLIIIPNQNLFRLASEATTFTDAFGMADDVLYQGVKGVTDLMVRPGLINLDFADVRSVMDEMGKAMMGTGEAGIEDGSERAKRAAEAAIANPLLDGISLAGAKGALINITGGPDMTLYELDEAANVIRETVDEEANIIVGSTLDPEMEGRIRVSLVATGIDANAETQPAPVPRRKLSEPIARPVADEAPAPVEEAPAPEPAVVAAPPAPDFRPDFQPDFRPAAEAAPAPRERAEPEPEAFDGFAPSPREEGPAQVRAQDRAPGGDELPAPAYEPAPRPQRAFVEGFDGEPSDFVAPRRAPAAERPRARAAAPEGAGGDTLARLRAAAAERGRPVLAAERDVSPAEPRNRGFGGLIGRMTGAGGDAPRQPDFAPAPQGMEEPEDERIEIPAFLRRQAN